MKRGFLVALLVLAPPVALARATEPDALAAIDACIPRLDVELDVGYERIAARCPDLTRALEDSGWAAWLPRGWKEARNDLSAGSLAELRTLVARELSVESGARAPRVERLGEILADLGAGGREGSGQWARFRKWLRSLFEQRPQEPDESWLGRLVERIGLSEAVSELITYTALALVVVLAGLIVVNELRAAGLLGSVRKRTRDGSALREPAARVRATWRDVEGARLADKPRILLDLVAGRLMDLGRLPPAGALTVRELTRAARLGDETDRRRLAELALAAERARYSNHDISPAIIEAAVDKGRELLVRLETREVGAREADT